MQHIDTRRLSPSAQEALRLRVVAAVEKGLSQSKAALTFGVSRQSVIAWMQQKKLGGVRALKAKKRGRPAEASKLEGRLAALVVHIILTSAPEKHGCTGVLWTRATVAELIVAKGGPVLSKWTVGRLLKRWKMTPQKPAKRALEQDPAAVARWLKEDYPQIVAKAKAMGAEIHWLDETGIRADHQAGRTYGRKGRTPIVEGTGQRWTFNLLSTLTNKGFLRFMTYGEKFDASTCIDFLKRLTKSTSSIPFIIWDRHPVHRSKKVQSWLKEHEQEICCSFLPAYYPQGNPVELLNQDLKANAVGRKRPTSLQELKKNVRSHLRRKQHRPIEARAYFKAASVRYAGDEGV
jgi:transposase